MARGCGVILAVLLATVCATAGRATTLMVPGGPDVLLVGDSVATGMYWNNSAIAAVQRGINFQWQVAICRRTTGQSCVDEGVQPQTLVDLVDSFPSVSPTVVLVMGYNDFEPTFAAAIDEAMQTLVAKGATHVLWLTLREARDPYPALNGLLAQAAARWPQLSLLDWNAYSVGHPDWFQTDGVHLLPVGGLAMAHFVHAALMELLEPLRVSAPRLPTLHRGRPFSAVLHASGGTGPYRFRIVQGVAPRGIHLLANGRLYGTPKTPTPLNVVVQATDSEGLTAATRLRDATT